MKIAKVLVDTKVYFKGNSQIIPAGTTYPEDALIVKENKELFVFETTAKEEPKKQPKRKGKKKEELKEELLIEEPVSVLEVTEVTEVEKTTEEK